MTKKFNWIAATLVVSVMATSSGKAQTNSKPAKWVGEYGNNNHTVQLFSDNSYLITTGKTFQSGNISWQDKGTKAVLVGANESYKVSYGKLTQTVNGEELMKNQVSSGSKNSLSAYPNLTGGRWVLVELNGKKITPAEKENKLAFLRFDAKENRYSGYTGCNGFGGSLEKLDNFAIGFGQSIQTMKACIGVMEMESQFMDAIQKADNYTISNGILSLNKARMASMARFQWVKD